MAELGLIRADMREIVGVPYSRLESYPVTSSDIRRWAQAVYYPELPPGTYLDPDRAASGDLDAPLDFNPFAWGPARKFPLGTAIKALPEHVAVGAVEHHLGVVPPDLRRGLNGGVSADFTAVRMRPGDVISAETCIAAYSERAGKLGPMLMTETATTWTNLSGATIKTERMTLIRY